MHQLPPPQTGTSSTTSPNAPTHIDPVMRDQMMDVMMGDTLPLPEQLRKPLTLVIGASGTTEIRTYPNYVTYKGALMKDHKLGVRLIAGLPWIHYAKIVGLFKKINELYHAEVLVYVWRKGTEQFAITVPIQRVSGARVEPDHTIITPPDEDGWQLWGHIHSHNTMSAFFSSTDDASEKQEGLIYGVVGQILSPIPETKWRIRTQGAWVDLAFDSIVEIPATTYPTPPQEWLDNIKEFRVATGGYQVRDFRHQGAQPHFFGGGENTNRSIGANADVNRRLDTGFRRVIRLDGTVWLEWQIGDYKLVRTTKRAEELSDTERRFAFVEGTDWNERPEKEDGHYGHD